MTAGPWWFQAVTLGLNAAQTVALAYIYTRWRRVNGGLEELERRHREHLRAGDSDR